MGVEGAGKVGEVGEVVEVCGWGFEGGFPKSVWVLTVMLQFYMLLEWLDLK